MIRKIEEPDFPIVQSWKIEGYPSISKTDPWEREWVYFDKELLGYLNFSHIIDRIELNMIYIEPNSRRKGIADLLLKELVQYAEENRCFNITLEVRETNAAAFSLYQKWGFQTVSKRKNYYGSEDAILMIKKKEGELWEPIS